MRGAGGRLLRQRGGAMGRANGCADGATVKLLIAFKAECSACHGITVGAGCLQCLVV